jgi:deoxyribodipyrimidine photolyase
VIFEKKEVAKDNGEPYTVYTIFLKSGKNCFQKKITTQITEERPISKTTKK